MGACCRIVLDKVFLIDRMSGIDPCGKAELEGREEWDEEVRDSFVRNKNSDSKRFTITDTYASYGFFNEPLRTVIANRLWGLLGKSLMNPQCL